jgi:hypothetical protein
MPSRFPFECIEIEYRKIANERVFFDSLLINTRSISSQPPVPEETPKRTYLHPGAFLPHSPLNDFPTPE